MEVHEFLGRWIYEVGIPFHTISHNNFDRFFEVVHQFGPRYITPNQYMLREPLLKKEVERTKEILRIQEDK